MKKVIDVKQLKWLPKFIPKNRAAYVSFDIYDLEEERI